MTEQEFDMGREAEAIFAALKESERLRRESLKFDIPEKLIPSTAMGLAMTAHFADTPPEEFV